MLCDLNRIQNGLARITSFYELFYERKLLISCVTALRNMSKNYFVSAVIPTYNRVGVISEVLKSAIDQNRKFDEIIVVDDGSTDSTKEIVRKFKEVKLLRQNHKERAAARNFGFKSSKGNIIAFIDSDLVLSKDWLKEVLKGFELGYDAVVDARFTYKPKTFIARMNDAFFIARYKHYKPFNAWVFKREVFEDLGGYDVNTSMGAEDVELGDRLLKVGYKIYFARNAICYHMNEPQTMRAELRRAHNFGLHTVKYRINKGGVKFWLKQAVFLSFFVLWLKPFWLALLFLALCAYAFAKDAFQHRLELKYLFFHPVYAVLSEFLFTLGLIVGVIKQQHHFNLKPKANLADLKLVR